MASPQKDLELYWLLRARAWQESLGRFDAETAARVLKLVRSLKADIARELKDVKIDSLDRSRLLALDQWIASVAAGASGDFASLASEAFAASASASLSAWNSMMTVEGAAGFVTAVGFTSEQLRTWFAESVTFGGRDLIATFTGAIESSLKRGFADAVRKGGLEGEGVSEIAGRILRQGLDSGVVLLERDAVSLARTYVQTANVQAQDAVMQANRRFLRGWRWKSMNDSRCCPACGALDGKTYGLDEPHPRMPLHFRCRCIKQWLSDRPEDMGKSLDEIQRTARTWIERARGSIGRGGGRRILNMKETNASFGENFMTLRPELQNELIGPLRAGLVRTGELSYGDMADKATGRLKSLKELGFDVKNLSRKYREDLKKTKKPL